jgi:methyl-accepting chemotaxis protein
MKQIMGQMLSGRVGVDEYVFTGIPKIAGFAPVGQNGWAIAFTQNSQEFLATANSLRNITLIVVGSALGIVTIILLYSIRRIVRPINAAVAGLKDIAQGEGDLTMRLQAQSKDEVGELAKQTAAATYDIKDKAGAIQGTTAKTVQQISEINAVITDVNEVVSSIATAVEEQSAATQEIASNVNQMSQGINEVNENVNQSSVVAGEITKDIVEVSTIANEMFTSSAQVSESAHELSALSEQLSQLVGQFKTEESAQAVQTKLVTKAQPVIPRSKSAKQAART